MEEVEYEWGRGGGVAGKEAGDIIVDKQDTQQVVDGQDVSTTLSLSAFGDARAAKARPLQRTSEARGSSSHTHRSKQRSTPSYDIDDCV